MCKTIDLTLFTNTYVMFLKLLLKLHILFYIFFNFGLSSKKKDNIVVQK